MNNSAISKHYERGATLVISLIMMLLILVVALGLYRGNNLIEKIAGNTREKQRAFQSAQNALLYGEYWLATASSGSLTPVAASDCTGSSVSTLQVCPSTNLATSLNLSSLAWYKYTPPGVTFASSATAAGLAGSSSLSDVNYSQQPTIYIAYLGLLPGTSTPVYQVTATGYGGNSNTVSVVQSTYKLGSGSGTFPPILSNP